MPKMLGIIQKKLKLKSTFKLNRGNLLNKTAGLTLCEIFLTYQF